MRSTDSGMPINIVLNGIVDRTFAFEQRDIFLEEERKRKEAKNIVMVKDYSHFYFPLLTCVCYSETIRSSLGRES